MAFLIVGCDTRLVLERLTNACYCMIPLLRLQKRSMRKSRDLGVRISNAGVVAAAILRSVSFFA